MLVTCTTDFNHPELLFWFFWFIFFLGGMKESWEGDSLDQKRTEYVKANNTENYAEILALKERTETLEGQLAALEEQCRIEKKQKRRVQWANKKLESQALCF